MRTCRDMKRMRVLITEAKDKKSLAALRSLGKRGFRVDVSGTDIFAQSFYSKYSNSDFLYPDPRKNMEGFIKFMLDMVKARDYDVLLPMGLRTNIPFSRCKDKFDPYVKIPIADYDILILGHNKPWALKKAEECGVPIPKTYLPKNREQVKEVSKETDYPVVIKLRSGEAGAGLRSANSAQELMKKYVPSSSPQSDFVFHYELPMIQEYIPGEVHDVCVLFNKGEPRATLTQKRVKMLPIGGGVGIVNETTDEPRLKKIAIKLMKKLRWHGPAQIEFKIDSRDDTPKLIEVNPKFWGTLDLSIQAGVDFPYLACKMAMNGDIDPVYDYEVGLKYRWLLPYELRYLIRSKNKWKSTREFLNFRGDVKYDIWLRDPLPFAMKIFGLSGVYPKKLTSKFWKLVTDKTAYS